MAGGTTMVCALLTMSRPCGTSILKCDSVMTAGEGPQMDSRYSGPPSAGVMSVPKTSLATAISNSATPSNTIIATGSGFLAALSCTLSILPLLGAAGKVEA